MRRYHILASILITLGIAACGQSVDPDVPDNDNGEQIVDTVVVRNDTTVVWDSVTRVTATFEKDMFVMADSTATKVCFGNDSLLDITWEVGDSIYIFNKKAVYYTSSSKVVVLDYNRATFVVDTVYADGRAGFKPSKHADLDVFDPDYDVFYACMAGMSISTPTGFLFDKDCIQSGYPSQNYVYPGTLRSTSFQAIAKARITADGVLDFEFHPVGCFLKVVVPEGRTVMKIRVVKSDECAVRLSCYYQILLNSDGTFYRGVRGNGAFVDNVNTVSGAANISYNYVTAKGNKLKFPAGTYYLPFCCDGSFKALDIFSTTSAYIQYKTDHVVYGELGKVIDLTDMIPTE